MFMQIKISELKCKGCNKDFITRKLLLYIFLNLNVNLQIVFTIDV